jgi:hypothetical protein
MKKQIEMPTNPIFHWLPKHLNHITENIVFKKRNVSFLAINKVFRQPDTSTIQPSELGNEHFEIIDFVEKQPNDLSRTRAEMLKVVFRFDNKKNIIVITAISENDRD